MRARLALHVAGVPVRLREILLRDKPRAFLDVSPSATVPCLVDGAKVIDESLDVMIWALKQNDPEGWLEVPNAGWEWIRRCDGPFKHALDRTKYAVNYPEEDLSRNRADALQFLSELDEALDDWLVGRPTLADFAILPFVRQFAFIDKAAFDALALPALQDWLGRFLNSSRFEAIMQRYPQWEEGDAPIIFP